MGGGSYTRSAFSSYVSESGLDKMTRADQIYTNNTLADALNMMLAKDLGDRKRIREARDNDDHPTTTPVIVSLDVSGSMGAVLEYMAKTGMDSIVQNLYDRLPVPDPSVLAIAVDDVDAGNFVPFQVTQFEADIRIQEQLRQLYFERGGGGNNYESYALPLYFAARHTATDAWEKRQKKGYLFTIGDEQPQPRLTQSAILRVFGDKIPADISVADMVAEASKQWEVFHIMVEQGSYMQGNKELVTRKWTDLLGQRAISLPKIENLAEVLVSSIQIAEGANIDDVIASWKDEATKKVIKRVFAKDTEI